MLDMFGLAAIIAGGIPAYACYRPIELALMQVAHHGWYRTYVIQHEYLKQHGYNNNIQVFQYRQ